MAVDKTNTIKFELPGAAVNVVRKGSGPKLFMLHGGDGPVSGMPFADKLAESFEIIAPVHPGFEGSPIPDHFDDLQDLVYLYRDLMDVLELGDAIMMGFSMGGWTAVEIAVMSTAQISKLILVDSVGVKIGGREDRDIADVFALPHEKMAELAFHDPSMAPNPNDIPDEQLQIIASNRIALGVYTWEPYMHNPKLPGRLHRIKVPTHFIWGESDGIVTVDYGRKFCAMIDGAKITVIKNAGHAPQIEQPDAFVDAVFEFSGK